MIDLCVRQVLVNGQRKASAGNIDGNGYIADDHPWICPVAVVVEHRARMALTDALTIAMAHGLPSPEMARFVSACSGQEPRRG